MTNRMRLLVGALLIVSPLSSVTHAARQEAQGRAEAGDAGVSDFVRRIHTEGIAYDTAKKYASEDSGILRGMLQRVDAQYWPNVTMVLGATGDAELVRPLIDFLHGGRDDTSWSSAVYRGRASALTALGYLVHDTGDAIAMEYLLASVDPGIWIEREIPWLPAHDDSENERLRVLLSTSAILALALTGRDEAGSRLRELTAVDGVPARLRQVAESVLPDWTRIKEAGLSEYYRTSEQGAPLAATPSRR